jgi:Xaa-Pro aminopeptidase
MSTRFALAAGTNLPASALLDHAIALGLDAVEVSWPNLVDSDREALIAARAAGIQTTSVDLGAVADPRVLEFQLDGILSFSGEVSNRRLLITATAPGGDRDQALATFVDGLRWLADHTEPLGFAVVVRTAQETEHVGALLADTGDLREVLARVNRGNVSASADVSSFDAAGENGAHSTADLVGRLGHASIGAGTRADSSGYPTEQFLADLSVYGYGDVVAIAGGDLGATRSVVDGLGGSARLDEERIASVQRYLTDDGLDALVLNASKNIVSLTGYWPMNGTVLAFVPREGEPHLFVPAGEETWASRSGWQNIHVYQAGRIVDPSLADSVLAGLSALSSSYGLAGKRIGIEGPLRAQVPPHMAHEVSGRHEALRPVIAQAFDSTPEFIGPNFTRVRAQKTPQELQAIRRSAAIADVGLRTFRDGLAEGVRDIELATEVESALERFGIGRDGVTRVRGYAFVMSGPQTSQTHLDYEFSSTRVQRRGDNVLMELAVVADGYWQDLSRAFVIGEPTGEQQRIYDVAEAAFQAAAAAAVPGAIGHDVDKAARDVIERAGLSEAYPHQTGHGVGVAFHEQYPLIKPGSDHVLEAGNVIAIEPGVYIPGIGGVRNEDNLLVQSPDGATTLQTVPHAVSVSR